MTNALLTCITCNNIFRSRSDLTYHVKRDHQSLVKVKFENGSVTEIKKGEDDMFKCKCGKRFKLSITLRNMRRIVEMNWAELEHARSSGYMQVSFWRVGVYEFQWGCDRWHSGWLLWCADFSWNVLIVEDEELRKIECIINEKMKWIICLDATEGYLSIWSLKKTLFWGCRHPQPPHNSGSEPCGGCKTTLRMQNNPPRVRWNLRPHSSHILIVDTRYTLN